MEKILLPFNLPVNLQVTSFYRNDGTSHASRKAIDLFPLIDDIKTDYPRAVAIYTATFLALFGHMKHSRLRINESRSCWHYHYMLDPEIYEAGIERYSWSDTSQRCEKAGDATEYDGKAYGFSGKLSAAIGRLQDYLLNSPPVVDVFTPDFWRHLYAHFKIENLPRTYIYFDPKMIDVVTLQNLLKAFTGSFQWTPAKAMLPAAPGDIDATTEKIIVGAAVVAAILFLRD